MAEDFYPFVDSGDPAPDNSHLHGEQTTQGTQHAGNTAIDDSTESQPEHGVTYATRISVYDDMLSTPRIIVIEQQDVRTYLEEITNTVYRVMKEQGGCLSLMVIRELVENFIHARFTEPVISVLDGGNTIRFADQGPGIADKERAFEFGVTSADREQKRYIRGTGAGLPMVQQYLENAGGAVSIEDNLNQGTVVTVSVDAARVGEITRTVSRGAAVRGAESLPGTQSFIPATGQTIPVNGITQMGTMQQAGMTQQIPAYPPAYAYNQQQYPQQMAYPGMMGAPAPAQMPSYQQYGNQFSTIPQQGLQPGVSYQPMGVPGSGQPAPAQAPYVSERGHLALHFLFENTLGGPTELASLFEGSAATWSRELGILADTGLVIKHGKKYMLTEMGKVWAQQA